MSTPSNGMTGSARAFNDRVEDWTRGVIARVGVNRGAGRMVVLFVLAVVIFAVLSPRVFLSPLNLQNIAVAAPEIGVIAIAMMLAMLTGGIDLSLVASANLAAIAISTVYSAVSAGDPASAGSWTLPLILLGPVIGALCGLLNGVLVSVVGITPILATLGTMQLLNGIAVVWTGGTTLYGVPQSFTDFGRSAVGPVPTLFILFIVIAVVVAVIVNRTALGRKIQLVGANPVAARYSGISGRRVLMRTYVMGGTLAGIAGLLFVCRNPTASADYGASYVLLVIVIAVLGGTRPSGGFASVAGVVLATLTLQVVSSGFTGLRLSSYQYAIAQGVILIAVMIVDSIAWRRPRRRAIPATSSSASTPGLDLTPQKTEQK